MNAAGQDIEFQFTPLYERQHIMRLAGNERQYFNSRLYMRGNLNPTWRFQSVSHFNSRLYMKGNQSTRPDPYIHHHFNSRLYMRGNVLERIRGRSCIFQFTPLHERQPHLRYFHLMLSTFQFSPLHERQLSSQTERSYPENFNSRLCMRGNMSAGRHPTSK